MGLVRLEQVSECELLFLRCEISGGLPDYASPCVFRLAGYVVIDLYDERRNQVEVLVDARELIQQLHHAVVILKRMHPDPRKTIFACDQILVERLVHVPEEYQTNGRHRFLV